MNLKNNPVASTLQLLQSSFLFPVYGWFILSVPLCILEPPSVFLHAGALFHDVNCMFSLLSSSALNFEAENVALLSGELKGSMCLSRQNIQIICVPLLSQSLCLGNRVLAHCLNHLPTGLHLQVTGMVSEALHAYIVKSWVDHGNNLLGLGLIIFLLRL